MHHPKVIRKSVLGSSFHVYMYVFRIFIAMSVLPPPQKKKTLCTIPIIFALKWRCTIVTSAPHSQRSSAMSLAGWFISWKIVFKMDDLGLHSFQETGKMVRKWCKRMAPTCSNRFKAIPLSFRWMLSRLQGICEAMIMWNGNLWSNDNVKHYFLWKISSLNLCILFNPEFWSSTILQTRTQCPQLIQHNSITDKVSHTFPVSSVCSKAPPIPPLARRVCRGIGTHHHCLLAYGKKAIMLDKPIVSRISWRYSSSMIRLSIVEVRHHCFTFQPWESMRYSFFFSCFCWQNSLFPQHLVSIVSALCSCLPQSLLDM